MYIVNNTEPKKDTYYESCERFKNMDFFLHIKPLTRKFNGQSKNMIFLHNHTTSGPNFKKIEVSKVENVDISGE